MISDIGIPRAAKLKPIEEAAAALGSAPEELEVYGRYKAEATPRVWGRVKDRPDYGAFLGKR
ncbi:MAG: hypothetical protein PWR31_994 [Bacillota bacterium]|nr:hypothetical protein [Bacillota bacterium]